MFNVINNLYNNRYSLSDLFRTNPLKKKLYNEQNKITRDNILETNNNTCKQIHEGFAMELEHVAPERPHKNLLDLIQIDKSLKKHSAPSGVFRKIPNIHGIFHTASSLSGSSEINDSHVLRTGKAYPESIKVGKYNLRKEPSKILQFDKEFQKLYTSSRKKNKRKIYKISKRISKAKCKKTKCKKTNCKKKNIKIEQRKHISLIDRKKILFDQKYICNFCDRILDPNHEFDHIIPLYCGGKNKYSNYQALCKECHQYKSDFLDNKIINPMTTNNQNCDPQKVIVILKKIYQNHYS